MSVTCARALNHVAEIAIFDYEHSVLLFVRNGHRWLLFEPLTSYPDSAQAG
jgi:hypothetical protein